MRLLAHEIHYDLLALRRNPRTRVFTFAFPLILLVILVGLGGGHTTVDGARIAMKRFFVPGIIGMALLTSAYASTVASVVTRRQTGVYKRRHATPVPAWVVVSGQALTTLITALTSTTILLVVAHAAYGVGLDGRGLLNVAVAVLIGAPVFACVGFAVATLVSNADGVQPAVQLTMLPLYFISGIWFTTDGMPAALRTIGEALPVQPVVDLLHRAFVSPALPGRDLAVLAAWSAAGLLLAAKRFSWVPR
jgi:ABC-2 type transport system permease protein